MTTTQHDPPRRDGAGGGADTIARPSGGLGGTHARLIGALFLSAFVLYGAGNGALAPVASLAPLGAIALGRTPRRT